MTDHRAKKSGFNAEMDRKMEQRYDEAEAEGTPNSVMLWLNAVVGSDDEPITSCSQRELHRCLLSGVFLCKIMNKLLKEAGLPEFKFQKKAASPFVAMGNIDSFNNAMKTYGLQESDTFQSTDLYEGRKGPFLNVINGVHRLGLVANEKQYPVYYTGQQTKFLDNE